MRRASRAAAPPAALGGWGTYATIISFGLAVCLTGYLAIGENERAFHPNRSAAASTPVVPAEPRDGPVAKAREDALKGREDAPNGRASVPSLAVDTEPSYDAAAEEHVAIFESLDLAPGATPTWKAARQSRGAKETTVTVDASNSRNVRQPTRVAASVPVVAVAATPEAVAESPVSDRWQQFASALFRCERENVITGLVCKERARLQYCEGEWGSAPQCPIAVASLNTR